MTERDAVPVSNFTVGLLQEGEGKKWRLRNMEAFYHSSSP